MEMYMAIYKCRLCGKEFCHSGTGDKDAAATATIREIQDQVHRRFRRSDMDYCERHFTGISERVRRFYEQLSGVGK